MKQPRLRDSRHLVQEVFPLGEIPNEIITKIGAGIVFRLHTGRKDITGDDWGDILASAVGGEHLASVWMSLWARDTVLPLAAHFLFFPPC